MVLNAGAYACCWRFAWLAAFVFPPLRVPVLAAVAAYPSSEGTAAWSHKAVPQGMIHSLRDCFYFAQQESCHFTQYGKLPVPTRARSIRAIVPSLFSLLTANWIWRYMLQMSSKKSSRYCLLILHSRPIFIAGINCWAIIFRTCCLVVFSSAAVSATVRSSVTPTGHRPFS